MTLLRRLQQHRQFGIALLFRVVSRLVASLAQAAFLLLLARAIGPSEFGVLAVVLALGYVVSAVTSFGTTPRALRLIAESESEKTATVLLFIRLWGTILTVVICGSIAAFGSINPGIIALAIITSDQIVEYVQAYLAGTDRQILSSVVVVCQRVIPLAVVGLMTISNTFSNVFVVASLVITLLAGLVIPLRERSRDVKFWSPYILQEIRASTGYWMSSLAPNINQLQPPLLKLLLDASTVGLFAIATRLTNPLTIFVGALQTLLIPELARRRGSTSFRTLYRVSIAASSIYGLLLTVMAWLLADVMVSLLGSAYASAHTLIVAMTAASGLSAVAQSFQSKLLAEGRPSDVAWVIGVGSSIGLGTLAIIAIVGGTQWLWLSPLITHGIVAAGLGLKASAQLRRIGRHSA